MKTPSKFYAIAIAMLAVFFLSTESKAQVNVNANGNVGIGVNASNSYRLWVVNPSNIYTARFDNNNTANSFKYGLYNYLSSAGTSGRVGMYNLAYHNSAGSSSTYGLYNYSNNYGSGTGYGLYNYHYAGGTSATGTRYGIYNYMSCGSNTGTKYALYSGVSCGGNYAGYFSGNVFISGTLTQSSDAAKKENIRDLDGALGIVDQLDAKTYNYIEDENLALPTEDQYGFLAQDVEKVLPHLVRDVENPAAPVQNEEDGASMEELAKSGPQEYETVKSVNYIGMIPLLVKAVQEQQEIIENQQKEIEALKAKVGN